MDETGKGLCVSRQLRVCEVVSLLAWISTTPELA